MPLLSKKSKIAILIIFLLSALALTAWSASITHNWTTAEPDCPTCDVSSHNFNDHYLTLGEDENFCTDAQQASFPSLTSHVTSTWLDTHGGTAQGALITANTASAISSGNYALQLKSGATTSSTAVGFLFDTANALSTNGAKALSIKTAGTELFYAGRENATYGARVPGKFAVGDAAAINKYSALKIQGTMAVDSSIPAGTGMVDILGTLSVTGAIKQAAAFNAAATVTGSGVLPFISGMLFQVTQSGTGSWGANPGAWGQSPMVIGARWKSTTGAASFGNWASVITAGSPNLATDGGVTPDAGTYIGVEVQPGQSTAAYLNGVYVWPQEGESEANGIYVGQSIGAVVSRGMYLHGDGPGSDIVFGTTGAANIYSDGTDLVVNPGGKLQVVGEAVATAVTTTNLTIRSGGSSGKMVCWKTATALGYCDLATECGTTCN